MNNPLLLHHDQIYLDALRNGDRSLIEKIYTENASQIASFVQKNGGSAEDAADLFQDVLCTLYRQAQDGFQLRCPFSAFLFQVCKRRWFNVLRGAKNKFKFNENLDNISSEMAEQIDDFELRALQEQLFFEKFTELGPACQEILGLSWQENDQTQKRFSLQEVASKTGRTYDYVRKKISECRDRLMQLVTSDPKFQELS